jgi:hypothetical protein
MGIKAGQCSHIFRIISIVYRKYQGREAVIFTIHIEKVVREETSEEKESATSSS